MSLCSGERYTTIDSELLALMQQQGLSQGEECTKVDIPANQQAATQVFEGPSDIPSHAGGWAKDAVGPSELAANDCEWMEYEGLGGWGVEDSSDGTPGADTGAYDVTMWAAHPSPSSHYSQESEVLQSANLIARPGPQGGPLGLADIFVLCEGPSIAQVDGISQDHITIPLPVCLSDARHWPQGMVQNVRLEALQGRDRQYFASLNHILQAFAVRGSAPMDDDAESDWSKFGSEILHIFRDESVRESARLVRAVDNLEAIIYRSETSSYEGHGEDSDDGLPELIAVADLMTLY